MISNKNLAQLYICRSCLNEHAKYKFANHEIKYRYSYYHFKCSECGEMKHIVVKVVLPYSLKLLFVSNFSKKTDEEKKLEKRIRREKRRMNIFKKLNW